MQQIYVGRDESGNLTRYVLTRQKLEDSSASASLSLPPKKLFLRRKQFFDQIALASVPSLINASSAGRQYPMSMTTSLKQPQPINLPHDHIKRVTSEFKERFGNMPTEHNWLLSYERLYKSISKGELGEKRWKVTQAKRMMMNMKNELLFILCRHIKRHRLIESLVHNTGVDSSFQLQSYTEKNVHVFCFSIIYILCRAYLHL